MGCDIHMYLEEKIKGKWVSQDKFVRDEGFDDGTLDVARKDQIYHERNYLLFSVLAGVRTFPFPPELWQKYPDTGFPEDADPRVRKVYEHWGVDAHTPSSLTLQQLTAVDWTKEAVPLKYDVTPRQKEIFDMCKNKFREKNGKFVQGAWKLAKPYLIDYFTYLAIKDPWISPLEVYLPPDKQYETSTLLALVPIEFVLEDFKEKVIGKMRYIADRDHRNADEIRIVFWFDN